MRLPKLALADMTREEKTETFAFLCLVGAAFTMPFSMGASRILMIISLACLAVSLRCARRWPVINSTAWIGFSFILLAVVVTAFGVNPALGFPKLRKLIWFIVVPVTATLLTTEKRFSTVLAAFSAGAGVLSIKATLNAVRRAAPLMQNGTVDHWLDGLLLVGSMTDAQRLMVGILVTLGLIFAWWNRKRYVAGLMGLILLQGAALLATFKRGSWLCTLVLVIGLAIARLRRVYLFVLLIVLAGMVLLPPVRTRLQDIRREFSSAQGGRWMMWTEIAPVLVKQHPWGIGYRSLTNDMMREIAPRVEKDRDHLHSNPVDILVSTGWLGLVLYLLWMAGGLRDAAVFLRRQRHDGSLVQQLNAMVVLAGLSALLLNGLVEYNFGDSEIVLIYGFLLGCAAAGRRWSENVNIQTPSA